VVILVAVLFCVYVCVRLHHSPSIYYYIRYFPIFQLFLQYFIKKIAWKNGDRRIVFIRAPHDAGLTQRQ
jgi:hypothetical protein